MTWGLSRITTSPSTRSCALLLVGVFFTACGGAQATTHEPTADQSDSSESDSLEEQDVEATPAPPPPPNCDDGTCFSCGEGICPQGAYCDQGAEGGAACAWISECKASPSCGCILKVLGSACSCEEASGGPTVSCP